MSKLPTNTVDVGGLVICQGWLRETMGLSDLWERSVTQRALLAYIARCPPPPETLQGTGWYIVYTLTDPRDGRIYYVGTSNTPALRLRGHLGLKDHNTQKKAWLTSLVASGRSPIMRQIDVVQGPDAADRREYEWIVLCLRLGMPLTNRAGVTYRHPWAWAFAS